MTTDRDVHDIYGVIKLLFYGGFILVTTVGAWVTGYKTRKRMRKALGKDVSEAELTSINAWMNVKNSEEKAKSAKVGGTLGPPL